MPTLQETERALYDEAWGVSGYADFAPGEHYLPIFLDMLDGHGLPKTGHVLDAGCGSGKGALALRPHFDAVYGFDLSSTGLTDEFKAARIPFVSGCLWEDIEPVMERAVWCAGTVDYVYCTDVMEHLPEAFTMLTIYQLLKVTRRALFLSICLQPDSFGVWVGRPLHQTVRDFAWWKQSLGELGTVLEARDLLTNGLYLVEPREC